MTENVTIERPDGTTYTITYNDGTLNRLDRLTSANYGMPINMNLCEHALKFCYGSDYMLKLNH